MAKGTSHTHSGNAARERPCERLLARGVLVLTDAELLAIPLRSGSEGKNAVKLGRETLLHSDSVPAIMTAPVTAWRCIGV